MTDARTAGRLITGTVMMRHVGQVRFPAEELVGPHGRLAALGRDSALWIFFGRGRKVVLGDGTEWRLKATTSGRYIIPFVRSAKGTIASSGPLDGRRSYGISGKDFAYTVVPLDRANWRHAGAWAIRRHETDVGYIDQSSRRLETFEPFPMAAAILTYALVTHGIPGETALIP